MSTGTDYTWPSRSNLPFLISDIQARWRAGLSARVPEYQTSKMVGWTWMVLSTSKCNQLKPLRFKGLRCLLLRPGKGAEYCDQLVCLCVCLSVREHISETAGPIFMKFFATFPCGRGSVLLWRRCNMICTSGFMDDVTFGRNGPYGDAWNAEPLTYYH